MHQGNKLILEVLVFSYSENLMYFVFNRPKQKFLLNRNAEEHFWSYIAPQDVPVEPPSYMDLWMLIFAYIVL